MEGSVKRLRCTVSVSWLNLHIWIPQRDVRKLIYGKLSQTDREMVEYAHLGISIGPKAFKYGVKRGYLSLLQWIYQTFGPRYDGYDDLCGIAAKYGHLETLQWLRTLPFPYMSYTLDTAIRGGHLNCIQWLIDNGCSKSNIEWSYAALYGHLHVLKWAHSQGISLREEECASCAAVRGHLERGMRSGASIPLPGSKINEIFVFLVL